MDQNTGSLDLSNKSQSFQVQMLSLCLCKNVAFGDSDFFTAEALRRKVLGDDQNTGGLDFLG